MKGALYKGRERPERSESLIKLTLDNRKQHDLTSHGGTRTHDETNGRYNNTTRGGVLNMRLAVFVYFAFIFYLIKFVLRLHNHVLLEIRTRFDTSQLTVIS